MLLLYLLVFCGKIYFLKKNNITYFIHSRSLQPLHSYVNRQIYFRNKINNMRGNANRKKSVFMSNIICWKSIALAQELTHLYRELRACCVRNVKT